MGQPITISRKDHTAAELRTRAASSRDADQIRRLLAIALILDGISRSEAAAKCGMDRQTLRDWVHRYNAEGVDGLKTRRRPGRTPRLTTEQKVALKALVIRGPDPAVNRVVRWRCFDLCSEVAKRFNVTVPERTMGKWLRALGLTRLQPRPFHPNKDAAAQQAFKKRMARPVCKCFLRSDLISLRQRIRPVSIALAKMEIRAPWSS